MAQRKKLYQALINTQYCLVGSIHCCFGLFMGFDAYQIYDMKYHQSHTLIAVHPFYPSMKDCNRNVKL